VLHPQQFEVDEAWIAFKLNDAPIQTDLDGDFNVVALMDAASGFLMGTESVPARAKELSKSGAKRLLKLGESHHQRFPQTLFIPSEESAQALAREAQRLGIDVVRVGGDQLAAFLSEVREAFKSGFGGLRVQ